MKSRLGPSEALSLILLGFVLVGFVAYPIVTGVLQSMLVDGELSTNHYQELFDSRRLTTIDAVSNSVLLSLITVVLSGILGCLLAFTFTQLSPLIRSALYPFAVLPVAMPPLVGVIAFLFVFGEGGILPRLLMQVFSAERPIFYLDGFGAIVAVHAYSFHVYSLLFVSAALRNVDASQLEAAASLGASPFSTMFRVIVPHIRPALMGAATLTFMSSMASFSAPFIFGGDMHFLTTLIYSTKLNGDLDLAAAQSALLMVVSALFFLGFAVLRRKGARSVAVKGVPHIGVLDVGHVGVRLLVSALVLLLLFEAFPLLTIMIVSFAQEGSWTWQLLPTAYTLENYARLFSDPSVFEPVQNSIVMGSLTVGMSALVGTVAAYAITKGALRKGRVVLDTLLSLPLSIPGTVIAIYLIVAFSEPTVLTGGNILLGTFWILPLAYFIRTYPMVLRSASSSLERVDDSIVESAEILGAGSFSRFRRIIFPLIVPGILAGSLLVMITALGEFVSSILLYTPTNRPISIEILAQLRAYNFGAATAYSVFLLLIALFFSWISERLGRWRGMGAESEAVLD